MLHCHLINYHHLTQDVSAQADFLQGGGGGGASSLYSYTHIHMAANYLLRCWTGHREQHTVGFHGFDIWTETEPQAPQMTLEYSKMEQGCMSHHRITSLSPNQLSSLSENISKPQDELYYRLYGNRLGFFHMCH